MSNEAEFWESFWARGVAPGAYFDKESAAPALLAELRKDWMPVGEGVALVPGMGRGYDIEAIARSDKYARVIGLDISEKAVQSAREYLDSRDLPRAVHELVAADFLTFTVPHKFALVLDYTFLCALPLSFRPRWAERMAEIVEPGGSLVTLIFPLGEHTEDGPPFNVSFQLFRDLLEPAFKPVDGPALLPDEMCHVGREGRSGFARWVRQAQ